MPYLGKIELGLSFVLVVGLQSVSSFYQNPTFNRRPSQQHSSKLELSTDVNYVTSARRRNFYIQARTGAYPFFLCVVSSLDSECVRPADC